MSDTCQIPRCKRVSDYIYYGRDVCDHCFSRFSRDSLRRQLGVRDITDLPLGRERTPIRRTPRQRRMDAERAVKAVSNRPAGAVEPAATRSEGE